MPAGILKANASDYGLIRDFFWGKPISSLRNFNNGTEAALNLNRIG